MDFTKEERNAITSLLISLMFADGDCHRPEEALFLRIIHEELLMTAHEFRNILEEEHQNSVNQTSYERMYNQILPVIKKMSQVKKRKVVEFITTIIYADGQIHPNDVITFATIIAQCDIDRTE